MKTLLLSTLVLFGAANYSQAQTVTYDLVFDSLIGLELTSGDICTAPFTVEEAKMISGGNMWGGTWTSTNTGTATSVVVDLSFSYNFTVSDRPTTLNGTSSNMVDPGIVVDCEQGPMLSWVLDPASYNAGGLNTFLVDYAGSGIINQIDNLPYPGDPYLRVTVEYSTGGASLSELNPNGAELVQILDLMGREVKFTPNTPLIYVYSDGSVKRVYEVQ
ncbi:MAG: hypothetical protein P8P74_04260 [Crocinitomicaceae bacterium]|nr:hypothetical protein [Crocinitomicaceae bacterium]